jgi:hypothetical protein
MAQELFSPEHKFPIEVNAYSAGNDINKVYKFGLNTANTIALLREIADKLERKDFILQGISTTQQAEISDFVFSEFAVRYAEKGKVG